MFAKFTVMFCIIVPIVGIFRRAYIKNKFSTYLDSKKEAAEI